MPEPHSPPRSPRSDADVLYKLLVVGEAGAGKTCLVRRYVHNCFHAGTMQTIGVDFALKTLRRGGGETTVLQLWDIAGQERYGQMMRVYFHGAVGALVVCDTQRPETIDLTARWKNEIDQKVRLPDGSTVPCVLALNKTDLGPCPRSQAEVAAMADELGFSAVRYTSAKTGEGVGEALAALVDAVARVDDAGARSGHVDDGRGAGIDLSAGAGTGKAVGRCKC